MQKLLFAGVLACLLAFAALGYARYLRWSETRNLATSRAAGDTIVLALRAYHADHKCYPQALQNLVPDYLATIPKSGFGTEYCYEKVEKQDDFVVTFFFSEDGPGWIFPSKRAIFASAGGAPWRIEEEHL